MFCRLCVISENLKMRYGKISALFLAAAAFAVVMMVVLKPG